MGEMKVDEGLKALRDSIDQVDKELLRLLNMRMDLAQQVGSIKASKGLSLFDPGREEVICKRLIGANPGPIAGDSLRAIYREIFAASRLLQHVFRVAFLGPEWTYSYIAAFSFFGHSAEYLPSSTLEDVFDALSKGKSHVAVVPIENSLQGGVGRTMDLLYEREVKIVRECYLEVSHYLCGGSDSIQDVMHLYAHPQALEQSRRWILEHLRNVDIYECASTAQAAQLAKKDPAGAAICNLYAGHHYGLNVLAERIEDHEGNTTRFFALGNHLNDATGNDKTSVLFAVSDQPGALREALESFARFHVNMTRIESRPNRMFAWNYMFYADVEGHESDESVKSALADLKGHVTFLKVLGSYPMSDAKKPIRAEKEVLRHS